MESFLSELVSQCVICRIRFACSVETANYAWLASWASMSMFTSLCRRLAFETLSRLRNSTVALSQAFLCLSMWGISLMLFFFPFRYPWAKLFSSCLLTSSPLSQDLLCLKIRSPSTVRMVLPHRGSVCFMFRWHRSGQCVWCYIYSARVPADGCAELTSC